MTSSVATVLTVYGIETINAKLLCTANAFVATVLTVYGIETEIPSINPMNGLKLQQYLPFTVLKQLIWDIYRAAFAALLQQYLPFTVLKQRGCKSSHRHEIQVATVLTVYGIETIQN